MDVRGGGTGTRESVLLDPSMTVERIDAIALAGGSAFGLDAAAGVMARLAEQGRGFAMRTVRVPIVPGAILFDLLNGGDKEWGRYPPYRELGYAATAAAGDTFKLGTAGAGFGASTANFKGGVGSASAMVGDITVGALVAVNAAGCVTVGAGPWFWAAPFERGDEFGGRGFPSPLPSGALTFRTKGRAAENTTLAVVATDATLNKVQAKRLAIMAQVGIAHAIRPVHTPLDGDLVFAAATARKPLPDPIHGLAELGSAAADVLARAVARAVYEATALPFPGAPPAWRDRFGTIG
jgi:L-aminopeptidase/D-esterase-like protein